MVIAATVLNKNGHHQTSVRTGNNQQSLTIPAKFEGQGSAVNGGELLFLALATCYCNDIYREAKDRDIPIDSVQVEVSGNFGGRGEPAQNIQYKATIQSSAPREQVLELMRHTDTVAEIHNTLRRSTPVTLHEYTVL
ncbi:MAG TPA: OsmC family protein [Terriglobus sp.]